MGDSYKVSVPEESTDRSHTIHDLVTHLIKEKKRGKKRKRKEQKKKKEKKRNDTMINYSNYLNKYNLRPNKRELCTTLSTCN